MNQSTCIPRSQPLKAAVRVVEVILVVQVHAANRSV